MMLVLGVCLGASLLGLGVLYLRERERADFAAVQLEEARKELAGQEALRSAAALSARSSARAARLLALTQLEHTMFDQGETRALEIIREYKRQLGS